MRLRLPGLSGTKLLLFEYQLASAGRIETRWHSRNARLIASHGERAILNLVDRIGRLATYWGIGQSVIKTTSCFGVVS